MRWPVWVVLGWLLVASGAPCKAIADECALKRIAAIPFDPEYAEPVIMVRINGSERRLLVNTATPSSSLAPKTVEQLQLKTAPIEGREIYVGGHLAARYATISKFQLAPTLPAGTAHFMVLPPDALTDGLDGQLGGDILTFFDLDFDFAHHTLNLISQKHCKGKVVYWTRDYATIPFRLSYSQHLVVPVLLDGKEVSAGISTADGAMILTESGARRVFDLTASSPATETPTAPKAEWIFRHRFESLSMGGVTVRNPMLYVYPDLNEKAFERLHHDKLQADPVNRDVLDLEQLSVGMDVLQHLHVYVAYGEDALYISAADAH